MRVSPSATAPSRSARCESDLSPGTPMCPRTAAVGSTFTLTGGLWTKSCEEFATEPRPRGTCPGTVPGPVPRRRGGLGRGSRPLLEHGSDDDAVTLPLEERGRALRFLLARDEDGERA